MNFESATRRPLQSRQSRWASATAGWLTRRRVRPNTISLASVMFAAMAKEHRMAALTFAGVAGALESLVEHPYTGTALGIGLVVIIVGSVLTIGLRIRRIASDLERR